jgi:hypothetical protein
MFENFLKKTDVAGEMQDLSEDVLAQAQAMVRDSVLENDQHTKDMFANGFTAPDGTQLDPILFLEQRKAMLESGDTGASHGATQESMVTHSQEERQLSDIDA